MSTKIYNGIKFKTNDIELLNKQLNELRPKFSENANKALNEQYSEIAYALSKDKSAERIAESYQTENNSNMAFRIEFALQRILYKEVRENIDPDYKSEVMIIPHNGDLYGIYYCDRIKENEDLIFTIADDFHYQNQTDRPEDISEEEWNNRMLIWDEILETSWIPGELGFSYLLTLPREIKVSEELPEKIKQPFLRLMETKK